MNPSTRRGLDVPLKARVEPAESGTIAALGSAAAPDRVSTGLLQASASRR